MSSFFYKKLAQNKKKKKTVSKYVLRFSFDFLFVSINWENKNITGKSGKLWIVIQCSKLIFDVESIMPNLVTKSSLQLRP